MFTPIYGAAPGHLQLGAGLLFADIDVDALVSAEDPAAALESLLADESCQLGATAEGCVFRCVPALLHTEKRGGRTPVRGTTLQGAWQVTLSGALTAVTPENAARLLNAPPPADGAWTLPAEPTCMDCLVWIGDADGALLLIELTAPLSTDGLTLRTALRGAGTMPFSFTAQQTDFSAEAPPCRLFFLKGGNA